MAKPVRILGVMLLMALLGWIAWEAQWRPQAMPLSAAMTELAPMPVTPTPQFATLSDYRMTLERPLFYPDRRPPVAPMSSDPAIASNAPGQPVNQDHSPRPNLTAIIEEHGNRTALLALPGQAVSTRLKEGEQLDNWLLVSIDDSTVTVENNGKREQLSLRSFGNAPPPPAAPVATNNRPRPQQPRFNGGAQNTRPPE